MKLHFQPSLLNFSNVWQTDINLLRVKRRDVIIKSCKGQYLKIVELDSKQIKCIVVFVEEK